MPRAVRPNFNEMAAGQACLPSRNGHCTARMYAALANGGALDGVRLVAPDRIADMQALQTDSRDVVRGRPCARRSA